MNTLYYGDNLKILRDHIRDESVDRAPLLFLGGCPKGGCRRRGGSPLDPPFNSNRNYNVLFKDESGTEADSQRHAFEDTWHWNQKAEETYNLLRSLIRSAVSMFLPSVNSSFGFG